MTHGGGLHRDPRAIAGPPEHAARPLDRGDGEGLAGGQYLYRGRLGEAAERLRQQGGREPARGRAGAFAHGDARAAVIEQKRLAERALSRAWGLCLQEQAAARGVTHQPRACGAPRIMEHIPEHRRIGPGGDLRRIA